MYSGAPAVPPTTATFDSLLNWYLLFGLGASIIVITLLGIFMVRYRYRGERGILPEHKTEGWKIVLVTVLISLTVLTTAEYQTFASFSNIEVPNNAKCVQDTGHPCLQVCVGAFQWGWNFTYPMAGQTCAQAKYKGHSIGHSIGNLTVPMGREIVLNISSKDVFHSFGITMFAVKEDGIPGKVNQLWFSAPSLQVPTTPDVGAPKCNDNSCFYKWAIRCFELCGIGHATMQANLTIVSQASWNAFAGGG
jgi:cytochrome c oxidase subunit II